jgi:hypothetical protein
LVLAQRLADALAPTLAIFVYSRQKEDLLGQDGMDAFAQVFESGARLAVILHRLGWGGTSWTGFEESHIKARSLRSHMQSFMVVRLDDSQLPTWVPATHLYASTATDSEEVIVGIIRSRARQEGADVRPETAADFALRQKRQQDASDAREQRAKSTAAVREVRAEVSLLFEEMERILTEIKASDPSMRFEHRGAGEEFGITRGQRSVHVGWQVQWDNTIIGSRLLVHEWAGPIRLPGGAGVSVAGQNWRGASAFVPQVSVADQWEWRREPSLDIERSSSRLITVGRTGEETYSTLRLADRIVRGFFEG